MTEEAAAAPPSEEVPHDPATGEIIEEAPQAVSGEVQHPRDPHEPWKPRSMGEFIDTLERGGFSHEAYSALQALTKGMTELAERTGKKKRGTFTIKVNIETESGAFICEAEYVVKAPKQPRERTMTWQDTDGALMPSMPRQRIMFGTDVGDHGPPRVIGSGSTQPIRSV